jgi:hypothetical protein
MPPEFGPQAVCDFMFAKKLRESIRGPEDAHTLVALAGIFRVNAEFRNPQDFLQFVERLPKDNLLPRFRLVESQAWLDNSLGSTCVGYDTVVEDAGWQRFPGSIFIQKDKGFYCIHPRASRFVVLITYSQNILKGQRPLSVEEEVDPFFKSLVFTPIK